MFDFLRNHDILLNTALRDSGCLVVMEAMSVGLPVVCIDTGGVKEMTTSETAIKVEPDEYGIVVDKLADGMEKLICDPELRKKMGILAHQRICNKYLYSQKCNILLERYKNILRKQEDV